MGDNKISEAAVEAASSMYETQVLSGANHELAWVAALDAALPHLQGEAVPVDESDYVDVPDIFTHPQPAELSEVSGDSGELGAEEVTLKQVINGYAVFYGSLRQAAELMCIDPAYLSRLAGGSKTNPSDEVLEKLGLERRVVYTRKMRDYQPTKLHPRTKCA